MSLSAEAAARKDRTNAHNATFEHRHFAALAAMLAELKPSQRLSLSGTTHRYICHYFADRLAGTNPRFDRKRFLVACGVEKI